MTAATSHRRATSEILAALETGLRGVTWHGQPALDRVEQFTEADLVEAFRRLLISEQRVCLIVAMDEEFNSETKGNKLIVRRVLPVTLLLSDRVLGNPVTALKGDENNPGAQGLLEAVLPAVIGQLLDNPGGVAAEPRVASHFQVAETAKEMPGRVCIALELQCRGGWLENTLNIPPNY